jgi:very-short-patch-repair endonuclease
MSVRWAPEDVARVQKRISDRSERPRIVSAPVQATSISPKSPGTVVGAARKKRVARELAQAKQQAAQDKFKRHCLAYGLPEPVAEYTFHPIRRFRWDFCWPEHKVAVEVQGGLWARGQAKAAHAMPIGILRDYEKNNLGQEHGWSVLFFTPEQLRGALPQIKRVLGC